ncbi:Uncharacterised protein [Mycobacteroides abscessus subsp. abscessus]|nr:Uncharacterised protein [Mycobacteroides abscessus subsp. abscessus]
MTSATAPAAIAMSSGAESVSTGGRVMSSPWSWRAVATRVHTCVCQYSGLPGAPTATRRRGDSGSRVERV